MPIRMTAEHKDGSITKILSLVRSIMGRDYIRENKKEEESPSTSLYNRQTMNNFCLPVLVILWGGTIIFLSGVGINIYNDYDDNLCTRNQTVVADRNYYNDMCTDPRKIAAYKIWDVCVEKEHSLHKSVSRMAMVDTAAQYGLCYEMSCEDFLLRVPYLLPMMMTCITIVAALLMLCGCILMKYGTRQEPRYDMPQHVTMTPKIMDNGYSDRSNSSWWELWKQKSKLQ